MKTPEGIKKWLECNMARIDGRCDEYVACVCCPYYSNGSRPEDVIAYIEQLEAQVPKWISVEERLPSGSNGFDFCVTVIVYTQDEQVTTGWNNCGAWYLLNWDNDFISKHPAEYVTHWMPLPEPPKEG